MLFAIALYAAANEVSAMKSADCTVHTTSQMQDEGGQATLSAMQLPYFPDAELAGTGIQLQQITTSRLQRINVLEYIFSLKSLTQRLADRDAVLSQHRGRLYDTTTCYYCHPASEYYVFALRRIIV